MVVLAIDEAIGCVASDRKEISEMREIVDKYKARSAFRPDDRLQLYEVIENLNEWERGLDEADEEITRNKQEHENFIAGRSAG